LVVGDNRTNSLDSRFFRAPARKEPHLDPCLSCTSRCFFWSSATACAVSPSRFLWWYMDTKLAEELPRPSFYAVS
jgi:hypothetical protein